MKGRVLIVDDEQEFCDLVSSWLSSAGHEAESSNTGEEALSMLAVDDFDLVVVDLNLAEMNGLELCERISHSWPTVPVVVITAFGTLESAIGAIRVGAYDFVTKPVEARQFSITIERALGHRALEQEVKRLRKHIESTDRHDDMVGVSPAMRQVHDLVDRVADTEATVLVMGESGTGKELVARALHRRSRRREAPFVAVNCAALPAALLEAELFGHTKGAFTDAKEARAGLFQRANGGSLFLDEVGEMPPEMQAKLLRALQERTVRPVGGAEEIPFDARLIAATNRDLEDRVEQGEFREDLYYRINVISVRMPPLRSRGNDVLLLAQAFIGRFAERNGKKVGGLSGEAAHRLREYNWPGNVRELENCIEAAVALTKYEAITVEDLPEKIRRYEARDFTVQTTDPAELPSMGEMERRYIQKVLNAVSGNKSAAAKILGFDRRTLYRKLEADAKKEPSREE